MSCTKCLVGDKTTITWVTSGFTADYTKIGGPEFSRAVIDTTTLGTDPCIIKCLSDKIDYGEIDLEWCMDPDAHPPFSGDPETIIITWPPKVGQTNGATLTVQAQMRRYKVADAQPNERMIASGTLVIICDPVAPVFALGA
jgi:hypothetical protein